MTPEPIVRTVGGIMSAQYVMVANEVAIFEALADEALALDALTARTELPERSVRIVAEALVASRLWEKEDGAYRNTPETFTFSTAIRAHAVRRRLRRATGVAIGSDDLPSLGFVGRRPTNPRLD